MSTGAAKIIQKESFKGNSFCNHDVHNRRVHLRVFLQLS